MTSADNEDIFPKYCERTDLKEDVNPSEEYDSFDNQFSIIIAFNSQFWEWE